MPLLTTTYYDRKPLHMAALLVKHDAYLIDIRRVPYSSRHPEWDAPRLAQRFKGRYLHAPGLGNKAFRERKIELADPEPWLCRFAQAHARGFTLWLMCACKHRTKCHREHVARLFQLRTGIVVPEFDYEAALVDLVDALRAAMPKGP